MKCLDCGREMDPVLYKKDFIVADSALGGRRAPRSKPCESCSEKPGVVCWECGRTVTEAEYSYGETTCCKSGVVPEEDYGKIDGFSA